MTQITITDQLGIEINGLSPRAGIASALNKYVKSPLVHLLAAPDLLRDIQKPLLTAAPQPASFGLTSKFPITLGSSGTELSIGAGAKAAFQVVTAGQGDFLKDNPFGDPIPVPDGSAYAAFTTIASLDSALEAEFGDLTFGFQAGGSIELMSALRFETAAPEPTVGSALRQVLERFGVPGDVEDLEALPEGAVAAVGGAGRLAVSASVDLATAANPIATPTLPLKLGHVEVTTGASLKLDVAYAVSGGYQIRVLKTGPRRVRLGYYKLAGSEFDIGVTAMASAGVSLGNKNLVEMVIGGISKNPEADLATLMNGGLTDDAIEAIQIAVRDAVNRSLSVALHVGLSSLRRNEAAFLYDIDLDQLDATGRAAVHDALDGNLVPITALESRPGPHGIQLLRSETQRLRKTGATLTINLLGIVNVLTIRELLREGRVLVEPSTSTLVIADAITATNITVVSRPFEADGKKLRKILFEHFMTTAALRAGALGAALDLSSSYTFFEFRENTNRQAMSDHLDAVVDTGLMTEAQKREKLADIRDFGVSTFLLESVFSNAACEALFLDAHGEPHEEDFYDRAGREALVALVRPGDAADFRAIPPANDALWARLREVGQPGIEFELPASLRSPVMVAVIRSDFTLIRWWATSMHRVAVALAAIKGLLKNATFDTLRSNHQFRDTHRQFEALLADVVRKSGSQFGDPWGVLALNRAAARHRPKRTALIVSPKLAFSGTIDET